MNRILIIVAAMLVVAGCSPTQRGAAVGAGTGAAIGAVATGTGRGAAIGAVAGGLAGALIGDASEPGQCRYRDRDTGEIFVDDC